MVIGWKTDTSKYIVLPVTIHLDWTWDSFEKCRWKARNPHQGDCAIVTFNPIQQCKIIQHFILEFESEIECLPLANVGFYSFSAISWIMGIYEAFQTMQIAHPKKEVRHWVLKTVVMSPNNLWGIKQYWMCCVNKKATFGGICPSIWAAPCGFNIHIHYTLMKGELNSFHSFTKVATLVSHTL